MSNVDHDSVDGTDPTQPTAHNHSSKLHDSPPRVAEIVLQPPTPASTHDAKSGLLQASTAGCSHGFQSLPTSSPALASLISSFPSPSNREKAVTTASSSLLVESEHGENVEALSDARHSWDGGETWEVSTDDPAFPAVGQTSLPYLDMGDNTVEEEQMLESLSAQPVERATPFWIKPLYNPPPRPAPTAALPALPHSAPTELTTAPATATFPLGTYTAGSSVAPLTLGNDASPGAVKRETSTRPPNPLLLSDLASVSQLTPASAHRGYSFAPSSTARSASPASFVTASQSGSPTNSVVLDPNSSPGQVARSLDIPRDAIKQMLETTQHVWRSHNVGPTTQSGGPNSSYLPRSRSFPILSSLYTSDAEAADASDGHASQRSEDRRLSASNVTKMASDRAWLEKEQTPGWAISKSSPEVVQAVGPLLSKSDKMRFRQTFLKDTSDEAQTISPNFSRPIGRSLISGELMGASASMPILSSSSVEPKLQKYLQSPLLLKGEAGCFFPSGPEEEQEILDSESESHNYTPATELRSRFREDFDDEDHTPTRALTVVSSVSQSRAGETPDGRTLARRNSDTALNKYALNFGKRAPGELHAWSVSVNDKGVPAIRPSPSAFHRPNCTLAGKNNATWQCGCRGVDNGDVVKSNISSVPRFGLDALPGQSSPGRNRSLSASNIVDPRQVKLWDQVEMNKVLIRKHEEEIAGLQEQVIRISSEIASARPSLSSAFNTPEPTQLTRFATPLATDLATDKPFTTAAEVHTEKALPIPAAAEAMKPAEAEKAVPALPRSARRIRATGGSRPDGERVKASSMKASSSLRDRLAVLSKMQLLDRDLSSRPTQSLDLGHSRFSSSSSMHSLGKKFRFPWSSAMDNKENFSEPTPFPLAKDTVAEKPRPSTSIKPTPKLQFATDAKESRPSPAAPAPEGSVRDKKYPPSARKYDYDSLKGSTPQSSVGPSHLRGQSEASSFGTGTSIFSSEGGEGYESRYGFFPKLNTRWDSISSRGTNASARSSADLATLQASSLAPVKPAMASSTSTPVMPSSLKAVDSRVVYPMMDLPRRSKTPPPRRSSLRKSKDLTPIRSPIPAAFVQSPSTGMAPISEQSEIGSPSSNRHGSAREDVEMSPVSIVNASITGPGRMSMSDRYNSQGLTVPISLPLSSSQVSLVSSPNLSPRSHMSSQFGGPDRKLSIDASPRLNKQPLQMGMSHGSLTIARQQPIAS